MKEKYNDVLTKEFLEREYTTNKKSIRQIAKIVGCSLWAIQCHLREYEIETRDCAYAIHLRVANHFEATPSQKDYIDGLLLGDGMVYKTSRYSAYYYQFVTARYKSWLKHIKKDFETFGIISKIEPLIKPAHIIKGRFCPETKGFKLRTLTYEEFLAFRDRWYPNGVKVVPRDINLESPQLLANWHMGDGHRRKKTGCLRMATHSFSLEDVQFLKTSLSARLNITVTINKNNGHYALYLGKKKNSANIFLNYTQPYRIPCFDYKWGVED